MNFCRHMKEGFNTKHASGVLLRKKRLEKCGRSGELLTHIKPGHVRNSSRTDVRSPEDLFAAARGAGFEVVVAVYRHNALARAVSSFEIHRYAGLKREDSGTLAARRYVAVSSSRRRREAAPTRRLDARPRRLDAVDAAVSRRVRSTQARGQAAAAGVRGLLPQAGRAQAPLRDGARLVRPRPAGGARERAQAFEVFVRGRDRGPLRHHQEDHDGSRVRNAVPLSADFV